MEASVKYIAAGTAALWFTGLAALSGHWLNQHFGTGIRSRNNSAPPSS
jgi:hypothetical protein